ncbi:beta-1,4-galactosyltransferase galt-1-like [Lissotriton helveticus]
MAPLKSKKLISLFCFLSGAACMALVYNITQCHHLLEIIKTPQLQTCSQKSTIASSTITALNGTKTFVVAAYYDNRGTNLVRIIGIVHHEETKDLYCWFHCRSKNSNVSIIRAHIDMHSDRFGFPYGTADILCPEPVDCDPKYVSIHWSREGDCEHIPMFEIRNRHPEALSSNFTVCISTMFGNYSSVLQFVQSVEMYKLLGVQKVMIYKSDCSTWMERVLHHYLSEGIVEIVPWPIASHLKVSKRWHYDIVPADLGYYGQLTALNDCIYRNMYRSRYLLLHDIDEMIIPLKSKNLKSMMAHLEDRGDNNAVFYFENFVFRFDVFDYTFNISAWGGVPGTNVLQHIYREPHREDRKTKGRKMIINPRKVIQTSVHNILQASGDIISVPHNTGVLYHCRKQYQPNLTIDSLIKDTTIWKYSKTLIPRVTKVLKNL